MSNECIFCKMIKGEMQANIVYEDDLIIAIEDINPQAPVHLLLIPKKHIPTTMDIQKEDSDILSDIFESAKHLAKEKKIDESGFRIVLNCNEGAGQSVFHIHFHLLGGRRMTWPPG
ncbi:MAG: histidine triad nucleotide-binding protein [Candidatus Schekmanbacteria bacterium]|nr:MAG: histidine triad nucleotide-binding protein [Candidatus Schekmanbacteria bacterium]